MEIISVNQPRATDLIVLVDGETVASGETSDAIRIMHRGSGPMVTIDPTEATSGKIQYTQSSRSKVAGDTATWYDWPDGAVTAVTQRAFEPGVTYLRCVATGGPVVWSVSQG